MRLLSIPFGRIVDKNINFLIGSGASYGIAPTLELKVKQENGSSHTIETLGRFLEEENCTYLVSTLFMHYYVKCIKPILEFSYKTASYDARSVVDNYEKFLESISGLLNRKRNNKQCNIFTTNYDDCFVQAIESLYGKGVFDLNLNDGAKGFGKKFLSARNFNTIQYETSPFLQHKSEIPQVNLVHLHGSVFWKKENELSISVNYSCKLDDIDPNGIIEGAIEPFSEMLMNASTSEDELKSFCEFITDDKVFLQSYQELPIVNPTKWKFHETVFEEHYYQMLRYMSYELEKENSILIVFGFSFADEHILNIIKRSLSNPKLKVYICCYTAKEACSIKELFNGFKHVEYIFIDDGFIDFEVFNKYVFNEQPASLPGHESIDVNLYEDQGD